MSRGSNKFSKLLNGGSKLLGGGVNIQTSRKQSLDMSALMMC